MGGEKECRVGRFIIANRAAQGRSHREGDTLAVELARKQEDACGKQGEGRRRLQGPEVGARSCVEHSQSRRLLLLLEGGPPSRAREGALIYCSPPGSSVHGILQARRLEWIAIPFSRGSSRPRDPTQTSCVAGGFLSI